MLFNSLEFLLFLPTVFFLYWFAFKNSIRGQNILLLAASYFFYGWWSWEFMGLLALSTVLDYCYGFFVASTNKRKAKFFLWLSVINNLGILGVFKYYNFFVEQFRSGFEQLGLHWNPHLLDIALPVGISFYTFHGMSYVFDIFRGNQKPVTNFIDYGVFVAFFPLLVAGPIERASHLLPQVQQCRRFNFVQAVEGCKLILWGMFKKVVIADSLAVIVDSAFNSPHDFNGLSLLVGAIAFAFQIYGDFSGYSDIALGTAKLFGFELLSNFRFPYFARDIAEFWRRWHISLSSWFRDYLYIPLGGSKEGKLKAVRNTFIIFLVSGFWHGANWTFIVWGGIHALGFMPLLLARKNRKYVSEIVAHDRLLPNYKEIWQMMSTFAFVTFAWVFFRADSLSSAWEYLSVMVSSFIDNPMQIFKDFQGKTAFIFIGAILIGDWMLRRNERSLAINTWILVLIAVITLIFLMASFGKSVSFIYFQF